MITASLSVERGLSGLLLVLPGLPLAGVGGWLLVALFQQRDLDCSSGGTNTCQLEVLLSIVGAMVLLLGLTHLVAGVGVWRHRRWADWLGAGLAIAWLALTVLVVLLSL